MIDNLLLGFSAFSTPQNLLFCFVGCLIGTVIGVLPGVGTVATLSILLPYTYNVDPISTIVMMAGIYYGAQYGGSTTSILLNSPGEPSSIMTCIDGNAMTKKGLAGNAIFAAGLSSFIAGIIAIILMAFLGTALSKVGLMFGPAEYCNLMLLGIIGISFVTNKDILTGFTLGCIGMLLGFIGTDVNTGTSRFTFGITSLFDGIGVAVIAIGMFGVAEVFKNLLHPPDQSSITGQLKIKITKDEIERILPASLRGTFIGSFLGLLPGGGTIIASFVAYIAEKRFSKNKHELGKGAIEGVAGPEAANNAASQVGFVPMLMLGIPENAIMALILAVLVIAGIQPGPMVMVKQPELFWAVLCSMVVGNLILLFLNIPLAKLWVNLLKIPRLILYPGLLIFSLTGAYYINNSMFEVYLTLAFGVLGYIFYRANLEPAPLVLGYILGPMFEENARRALAISDKDFSIFYKTNISIVILTVIATLIALGFYKLVKNKS